MTITKEDKITFLVEEMEKVNISSEDIIGMISMLETEDMVDEMIRFLINTPNLTEEKVVKALIIVVREAGENSKNMSIQSQTELQS